MMQICKIITKIRTWLFIVIRIPKSSSLKSEPSTMSNPHPSVVLIACSTEKCHPPLLLDTVLRCLAILGAYLKVSCLAQLDPIRFLASVHPKGAPPPPKVGGNTIVITAICILLTPNFLVNYMGAGKSHSSKTRMYYQILITVQMK